MNNLIDSFPEFMHNDEIRGILPRGKRQSALKGWPRSKGEANGRECGRSNDERWPQGIVRGQAQGDQVVRLRGWGGASSHRLQKRSVKALHSTRPARSQIRLSRRGAEVRG